MKTYIYKDTKTGEIIESNKELKRKRYQLVKVFYTATMDNKDVTKK